MTQLSKPKGQDLEDLVGFENNTKQGRISHVLLFMSPSQIKDEVLNEIKSERQKKNKCTAMSRVNYLKALQSKVSCVALKCLVFNELTF